MLTFPDNTLIIGVQRSPPASVEYVSQNLGMLN